MKPNRLLIFLVFGAILILSFISVEAFDGPGESWSSQIGRSGSFDIVDPSGGQLYSITANYTIYFPQSGRVCAYVNIFGTCINIPSQSFDVYTTVQYEFRSDNFNANDFASLFWDTQSNGGSVDATTKVRKVEILSFSSNKSSAEVGQNFSVSWNTDKAILNGVDLLWGGPLQGSSGSGGQLPDDTKTFTCSSVGTATFELRAEGPTASGLNTISQIITVNCNPAPVSYVNLNFYVTDGCSAGRLPGASVNISQDFGSGTSRVTDGNGFANFGVYANTNVGWDASKSGYSPKSGSVTTGTGDENVNVVLTTTCASPPGGFTLYAPACSGGTNPRVNLDWSASAGATDYTVFRRVGSGGWTNIGSTANEYFTDSSPPADTGVEYYIQAANSQGYQDSNSVIIYTYATTCGASVTPTPSAPPPPPGAAICSPDSQTIRTGQTANLTGSIVGGGSGSINWSAPGGSPSSKTNSATFSTTYSTVGLKTVTASSTGGNDTCTVNVQSAPPPPPPGQQFSVSTPSCSNSPYSATINWPGYPPDPTYGYFIDVAKTNGFSSFWNKRITNGATTTQALTGFSCTAENFCSNPPPGLMQLDPGVDYYTRVWNGSHIPGSTGYHFNVPLCNPAPILSAPTLPNCSAAPYTINLNWSGTPDPTYGFFADVTTDQSFSTFWNKKLSGSTFSTDALTGFSCTAENFCPGAPQNSPPPASAIQLNPSTWYYVRIYGDNGHSNTQPFNVPACTVSAAFSVNPPSGVSPFTPTLTAQVTGGNATGNITYKFDCRGDGYSAGVGGDGQVGPTSAATANYAGCTYSPNGSYTTKVDIVRQGVTQPLSAPVTVDSALPTVITDPATNITFSSATLNGKANPNGASATGWFRYGAANPGTCNDTFGTRIPASGGTNLGGGNSNVSFSQPVSGLTANTTYYFCAIASNSSGKGFGSVVSYSTSASVPVTSNVTVTQPNYCFSGPAATVSWNYSDPSGSPQSAYQVQIDDQGSFNSPEVDSGKVTSTSTSYASPQGLMVFDATYKARVRVWNQYNVPSAWVTSSTWKTPKNGYPQVNFTSPATVKIDEPVQFTDQTIFYDGKGDNNHSWNWLFGDGGSSNQKNSTHTYTTPNLYNVSLTATDNNGFACAITKPINIRKPIPLWKEVAPR